MSRFYQSIKRQVHNGYYWALDYVYAARWQLRSIISRADPRQYRSPGNPQKPTIILLPGVYESWYFMRPVAELLHDKGYSVHVVETLQFNTGSVELMAQKVAEYIQAETLQNCLLVAHSKGGLIGKYLLANHNDSGAMRGMIAINTPFAGSKYAYLLPVKSIKIFRPNSQELTTLALNKIVNSSIVSIYSQFDPHIPDGSRLEGAKNIRLDVAGHFRILENNKFQIALLESIKEME